MANIVTYPLNRIEYQASDAETHYSTRISGVYTTEDYKCSVTGANTTVTVSEGIAWIRNKRFAGKSACMPVATSVDLGVANASLPRWDVVCLRFDANENKTDIVVKNGTAASSPVIPAISQTETLYELYLCKVYRPAGSATISVGDVYDLRLDPELCGLMTDSVTEIDTSAINAQINSLIERLHEEIAGVEDESALMLKSVYDTDGDGVVDNATKLGGKTPGQLTFGADQIITDKGTGKRLPETLDEKMDNAGGQFIGSVYLQPWQGVATKVGDANNTEIRFYVDTNGHAALAVFQNGSWARTLFEADMNGNYYQGILMPKIGGRFDGDVKAYETARTTRGLFNNETRAGSTTGTLQSVKYFIDVT